MAVTYADIAKASGVSTAAVSLVLRNPKHPEFNPQTRQRILDSAKRLNYMPNRVAASLRAGQTRTLALVMPYTEVEVMDVAERVAVELGYRMMIQFSDQPDHEVESKAVRAAMEHRVDGLIWQPSQPSRAYRDLLPQLRYFKGNIVFMEHRLRGVPNADWIYCDVDTGIGQAVAHLRERGYDQLVYVSPPFNHVLRRWRARMFRRHAVQVAGVVTHPFGAVKKEDVTERIRMQLQPLAERGRLGIVCDLDWSVVPTLEACRALGLSLPGDAGVVGIGDFLLGGFFRFGEVTAPPFTAVRRPTDRLARMCVERLVSRIKQRRSPAGQSFAIETSLIERESTRPVGESDGAGR